MLLSINKIFWFLCVTYLFYLSSTTQSILFEDAFGYQHAAEHVHDSGILAYWSNGVPREPLYSMFVALVLHLSDFFRMDYIPVLLVLQVCVFISMLFCLDKLLLKLGLGFVWRWSVLFYAVFSPAFIYTVFIEWSEIVTYPLVLLIILSSVRAWSLIFELKATVKKALGWGMVFGLSVLALMMVKAVAELSCLCFIFPWMAACLKYWRKESQKAMIALSVLMGFTGTYIIGVNAYKAVNYHFNGQYVLTNRADWALYGNTARGMAKLTQRQWYAAVLSVPTNGQECWQLLKSDDDCEYWTFTPSDMMGMEALNKLKKQGYSASDSNKMLIRMSMASLIKNPLQASANLFLEGMKFMFWEYNAWSAFAVYPLWLMHVYENRALYFLLHYGMALLTFIALMFNLIYLFKHRSVLFLNNHPDFTQISVILFSSILIFPFIFFYSFFYCSGRYAMPLAPLFLAQIAFFLKKLGRRQ